MGFARHPPGYSPVQCCRACKVSAEGEGPGQSRSVLRRKARQAQVPTAKSREKLQAIASELQDSCCGAEHSCVHALQLLTRLGRHKHGVAPSPKVSRRPKKSGKIVCLLLASCMQPLLSTVFSHMPRSSESGIR